MCDLCRRQDAIKAALKDQFGFDPEQDVKDRAILLQWGIEIAANQIGRGGDRPETGSGEPEPEIVPVVVSPMPKAKM